MPPSPTIRNASRGELSATSSAAQRQADRQTQGVERFDRAHHAAVEALRGEPLHEADHRSDLQPVADTADERGDAREGQRRRYREAEVSDTDRERADAEHRSQ